MLLYKAKRLFREVLYESSGGLFQEVLRVRAPARPLVGWAVGCAYGRDPSRQFVADAQNSAIMSFWL